MKVPKPFATEADLCAAFLAEVPNTWTAWKEHAGWDILLVRKADGFQIGIEAKLKCNATVLQQALKSTAPSASKRRPGLPCHPRP